MTRLELLAPAKNLQCGIAAIDHGADAVYIGASRFGARVAAGNSIADIQELCKYAHRYGAKVYATVNTIIYDNELEDTRILLNDLAECGIDAVLVQDMAVMQLAREIGLTIHASTQTDNRTAAKVAWLTEQGFSRVVLARELSASEISVIHNSVPDVQLEVFVHGALCVSYSGLCYASEYCFGRSANRGSCAQFCRMQFDLLDAEGNTLIPRRHFLSLKDMNQSRHLAKLIDAGATSFKIEGRLKDVTYVKNVTAAYSQLLDDYISKHSDKYERASHGKSYYTFTPDLSRTFNRGYTTYFLQGRKSDIASFDTPKAIGSYVGKVKEIRGHSFSVAGLSSFANGDGLCFINKNHELEGFRVNRVEGNRLFPVRLPSSLCEGMSLYRSSDQEMERLLSKQSAERKIPVTMSLTATADGFLLQMGCTRVSVVCEHQEAVHSQRDNIVRQLSKLGGTPYECAEVRIPDDFNYFIPSSVLADMRRKVVSLYRDSSETTCSKKSSETPHFKGETSDKPQSKPEPYTYHYQYNVSNSVSRDFYCNHDISVSDAFELTRPRDLQIMQCRYCLRHALGHCVKHGGEAPTWREPLYLRLADGRRFRLQFDCNHCQMNVYAEE